MVELDVPPELYLHIASIAGTEEFPHFLIDKYDFIAITQETLVIVVCKVVFGSKLLNFDAKMSCFDTIGLAHISFLIYELLP